MLLIQTISAALSVAIFLGGVLVLLRSQKKIENITFFIVCLFSALWGLSFANIESASTLQAATFLNSASYVLGVLLMLAVTGFTFVFPVKKNFKLLYIYGIVLIPTLLLSATPLIAGRVDYDSQAQAYVFANGDLAILYSVVMLLGVCVIARNLLFDRKNYNSLQKEQAQLVATGFILSFVAGVGLSTVLPLFSPTTKIDDFSPFALGFLSLFAGFAIIRKKMFDFRAVILRALTYLFATLIIAGTYVALAFVFKRFVLPDTEFNSGQFTSSIVLTVVLVIAYPPIKKQFDRVTNSIFYRDAYDPQVFIDSLNKILVSNVDIEKLLANSSTVIEQNLKAQFCSFYIVGTEYAGSRVIGDYSSNLKLEDIDLVQKLLPGIPERIIYVEQGAGSEHSTNIIRLLKKNDVEVFARLTTVSKGISREIGYLLLGPKKSGNLYTLQDLKMIEIVANELVIALENALRFEEIEQFNVTLQKKIDEATSQLKRTNKKLQTLDEAKDEFISMASHQLRTPLTSIKGYLSMVLEGDVGPVPDQQKEMLTTAFTSAQRMVYLIADLLNVSRLQTGKFVIEPSECYLPDLITDELAQLREALIAKNINVVYDQPANFPKLKLDETKIRQVMMNFLDNSMYYTPEGGTVTIALLNKPKEIEFSVNDTGIGVPRSEQHKLFTKFYRAGNARKARPDGTGLGLFMAKKVIIASGGAVVFKSTEGKGSTFGFTFPRK